MSTELNSSIPLPEVLIFPARLLSAATTEKMLNRIYEVPNVRQVNLSGEGLPVVAGNGPAKGTPINHPERKVITVKGREYELNLMVGRIFVEINDIDNLDQALEDIKEVCNELLPFGYSIEVGRYSKFQPTITDYKKCKR